MYKQKSVLALITARGGSKGIPGKNIKLLGGKPLICWTIDAARACPYIDRLVLSCDDPAIISIAEAAGCEVPFKRPSALATDHTPSMDVILHALEQLSKKYDYLLLLQPTSPFRTTEHINNIIEQSIETGAEMMVSVKQTLNHPAFMFELKDNFLVSFFPQKVQARRQDMPTTYQHNGALYFTKTDYLLSEKSFLAPQAKPFVMSGIANVDLDEPEDWLYAEHIVQKTGMDSGKENGSLKKQES